MAVLFYPPRISYQPLQPLFPPRNPRLSPLSSGLHLTPRLSLHPRLCIVASSSDLCDPDKFNRGVEVPGTYQADSLALGDKLEAVSQLNESVQSGQLEVADVEFGGGDIKSGGGNGSGGNGGEGKGGNGEEGEGESEDKNKKMSASQKLTLAYAALVGVGGIIGYAKSKSTKSLISGAVSSAILLYVSMQLPKNPVYASSLGLGVSTLLLAVMGMRFKKSGKFFPAGIVSLVSVIMTGGYIHGIMRASHA